MAVSKEALLAIKKNLQNDVINLLLAFDVVENDEICISDIEDALYELRGTLWRLDRILKPKDTPNEVSAL